ncbi:MAG TPA: PrgI family protein [Candidatus Saccharimonadales bacterium]
MAVYKVPQDVEADDKLIGPFSFRQFVYLIIVAISIAIGWGLFQLFPLLAMIPLPIIFLFGALALPLRKDQPMEIYLAAVVSFYLKPRKRLWQADGIQSLVEITAPQVVEVQRAKDLSQSEAERRLSYLADIVDSEGWAIRGVATPQATSSMQNDVFFEAQQTEDILDTEGGVARSFESMIDQADLKRRQDMVNRMHQPAPATIAPLPTPQINPSTVIDPYAALVPTAPTAAPTDPMATFAPPAPVTAEPYPVTDPQVDYNPYPEAIHQSMIQPLSQQPAPQPAAPIIEPTPVPKPEPITTSENVISPDIINLANNPDLSIATIAHEANRIQQQRESEQEVVISLR